MRVGRGLAARRDLELHLLRRPEGDVEPPVEGDGRGVGNDGGESRDRARLRADELQLAGHVPFEAAAVVRGERRPSQAHEGGESERAHRRIVPASRPFPSPEGPRLPDPDRATLLFRRTSQ
jgi:hypothetical protein